MIYESIKLHRYSFVNDNLIYEILVRNVIQADLYRTCVSPKDDNFSIARVSVDWIIRKSYRDDRPIRFDYNSSATRVDSAWRQKIDQTVCNIRSVSYWTCSYHVHSSVSKITHRVSVAAIDSHEMAIGFFNCRLDAYLFAQLSMAQIFRQSWTSTQNNMII